MRTSRVSTSPRSGPPAALRLGWFPWAALAFVLAGAGYSILLGEHLRFPDERDYLAYARHLIQAGHYSLDGQVPDSYRPPGYSLALAPVVAIADSVHAVRIVQFALLSVTVWWLAGLAMQTPLPSASPRTGRENGPSTHRDRLATALLIGLAGYPVLIYTAGTLFPQALIGLLVVGGVALVCSPLAARRPVIAAALAGLLAGFTAEVSPTALMLVPVLGWYCLQEQQSRMAEVRTAKPRRNEARSPLWQIAGTFMLCAALVPGAWLVRNLIVLQQPVLFSQNLAENLDNAVLSLEPLDADEIRPPKGALEYGLERLAQLIDSPTDYLDRLLGFFATSNDLQVRTESSPVRERVMAITYLALLGLVALRLVQALPFARTTPLSRPERIALMLYLLTALFHALVFTRIRYRLPFDLLLLLPAMNAIRIVLHARVHRIRRLALEGGGES